MSLPELFGRSKQRGAQWLDRLASPTNGPLQFTLRADCGAINHRTFTDTLPSRFFKGIETMDGAAMMRTDLSTRYDDVIATAECICARRFDVLGFKDLSFGNPIDWHLDPVSGNRAPLRHWSLMDPLNEREVGDAKIIWELNRHQWLLPLAQAFCVTHEERYAQHALSLMNDWHRANPYGYGINWSSSLEVGYRLISWLWALTLLRTSRAITQKEASPVFGLVYTHAAHVERYLSHYFSPNTHLTGEALALFYAGTLCPEFSNSDSWRELGRHILIAECERQIHKDGTYFEQTTCYQRYTIEIYQHFILLAERNRVPVPHFVRDRTELMCTFLLALSAPDGTVPQIGDNDGGFLLPLVPRDPTDCRGLFGIAAVMFDREDFGRNADGSAAEVLWMLGRPAWQRCMELRDTNTDTRVPHSQLFAEGGYAVLCTGAPDQRHLIFDIGPLGCNVSSAHGHADLLSIQCSAFGEQYLVDPGTYSYSSAGGWRNYFRGSVAHSTVVVDEADQAEALTPFKWGGFVGATLRDWISTDTFDFIDASHDGYARLSDPVTHRRRVLFIKPLCWIVIDDIIGAVAHSVEIRFQFGRQHVHMAESLAVCAHGRHDDGLWIVPLASAPIEGRLTQGGEAPREGWFSPNYGRREPASVATYRTQQRLPVRFVAVLYPFRRLPTVPPQVDPLVDSTGQLVGLALPGAGHTVRFDDDRTVIDGV